MKISFTNGVFCANNVPLDKRTALTIYSKDSVVLQTFDYITGKQGPSTKIDNVGFFSGGIFIAQNGEYLFIMGYNWDTRTNNDYAFMSQLKLNGLV